mgnify:CR=1 FL=1
MNTSRMSIVRISLVCCFLLSFTNILISEPFIEEDTCEDCHDEVSLDHSVHEDFSCGDCHTLVLETGIDHGGEGGDQSSRNMWRMSRKT